MTETTPQLFELTIAYQQSLADMLHQQAIQTDERLVELQASLSETTSKALNILNGDDTVESRVEYNQLCELWRRKAHAVDVQHVLCGHAWQMYKNAAAEILGSQLMVECQKIDVSKY